MLLSLKNLSSLSKHSKLTDDNVNFMESKKIMIK